MRVSKFEIGTIGLLLILAAIRAASDITGFILAIGHISALLVLFVVGRHLIALISRRIGRLFFAAMVIALIAEISIQYLTGLHLNWFVISLLLEGGLKQNTGVSAPLFAVFLLSITLGLYWSSRKFSTSSAVKSIPRLVTLGLFAAVSTQLIYGVAYYHGSTQAVQARRDMPFFWTLHPYQANKLLAYVFASRGENPFSLSKVSSQNPGLSVKPRVLTPLTERAGDTIPNILVIVTDSLRSSDIQNKPELAPALTSVPENGLYSLDHYSVSNCTHFSLYSMATGELPTRYGAARDRSVETGFFSELAAAGFQVSTAESISLDWYDLSDIILPVKATRWIAENEDTLENDQEVTAKTIEKLSEWQQSETPGVHFAYYFGTHYPYSDTLIDTTSTKVEAYETTISLFDAEFDKILTALRATNSLDNTLVIVTSDHGEEFFADGRVGHASRLSSQQVQVPLLIFGANKPAFIPRSHLDISDLIYAVVEPDRSQSQPSDTVYLANCGYDFPTAFSVLKPNGRYDFDFNNGYLAPINRETEEAAAGLKAAAAELLAKIR